MNEPSSSLKDILFPTLSAANLCIFIQMQSLLSYFSSIYPLFFLIDCSISFFTFNFKFLTPVVCMVSMLRQH